jgi:Uma2 family endonuclease
MGVTKTILTAEQFDEYPFEEDKRYELDDGELIEMTRPVYRHNRVLIRLTVKVYNYFESTGSGEVLNSENLYALAPSIRRAPDLAIFLGDRSKELADSKVISIIPDIAAEVLSPSETPRMINRKLKQYFAAGVKEVWLIHPEAREIEICTGTGVPETLAAGEVLTSRLLPAFELPLNELFA